MGLFFAVCGFFPERLGEDSRRHRAGAAAWLWRKQLSSGGTTGNTTHNFGALIAVDEIHQCTLTKVAYCGAGEGGVFILPYLIPGAQNTHYTAPVNVRCEGTSSTESGSRVEVAVRSASPDGPFASRGGVAGASGSRRCIQISIEWATATKRGKPSRRALASRRNQTPDMSDRRAYLASPSVPSAA